MELGHRRDAWHVQGSDGRDDDWRRAALLSAGSRRRHGLSISVGGVPRHAQRERGVRSALQRREWDDDRLAAAATTPAAAAAATTPAAPAGNLAERTRR